MTSKTFAEAASTANAGNSFAPYEEAFQARVAKLSKKVDKLEEFMLIITRIECPECQRSQFCDAHRDGGSEECTFVQELRTKIEALGPHNRRRAQNLNDVEREVRSWIEALKVRNRQRVARLKATLDGKPTVSQPNKPFTSCIVS